MKLILTLTFVMITGLLVAQVPTPAPPQSEVIILYGGRAHIGNGEVIENSAIRFEDGIITLVADASLVKIDPEGARVIEIEGMEVYPGLIAPNTTLGLIEIGAVRATHDENEVGTFNPNVRSAIAYSTDSRVVPTIRSNGIMLAQITPQGGRISGLSSVMQLDAWNWEDATVEADDGMWMNWPSVYNYHGWWAEPGGWKANDKYGEQVTELKEFFNEAWSYLNTPNPSKGNVKFEAMQGVFDGSQKLYIRADGAKEIMGAIEFIETYDTDAVLVTGADAWQVADLLAEKQIPVILDGVHALPSMEDDDIDQPFKTPAVLQEAGVLFALGMNGFWDQRNLMFHAGTAVGHGLPYEAAISAMTSNTAQILGIQDEVGLLQEGIAATIVVSTGDILDMSLSTIAYGFINGREIDLGNKQTELYEKFKTKYQQQGLIED